MAAKLFGVECSRNNIMLNKVWGCLNTQWRCLNDNKEFTVFTFMISSSKFGCGAKLSYNRNRGQS